MHVPQVVFLTAKKKHREERSEKNNEMPLFHNAIIMVLFVVLSLWSILQGSKDTNFRQTNQQLRRNYFAVGPLRASGLAQLPVTFDYDNQRGSSERTFDMQNNDFGWKPLPFSSPLTWVGKLVRSRRQNALSEAKGRVCGN